MSSILKKDLIYNQLRDNILTGKLTGKLPKELDFARELGVGKITLRAAFEQLQAESLISRVHGRGTFVTPERERLDAQQALLLVVDGNLPWFSPNNYIIPDAYQYAMQRGFNSEIIYTKRVLELSEQELRTYLTRRNVVGIFLATSTFNGNEPILIRLKALGLPVVLPHARRSDNTVTGFGAVYIDASLAVDGAINYLVEKGHRKIAFIGNKDTDIPFRKKSLREVLSVLEKNGCSTNPGYFPSVSYGRDIARGVTSIMALDNPPTAMILFSDFFAINAYRAIKAAGKTIPADISVIGLCGCPDADMVTPHLSTIDFQYSLLAHKGVDLLAKYPEWFKSGQTGPMIYSDYKIIERDSVRNITKNKTSKELSHVLQTV
jgi:LacI family transcriptional regulator, sucrose operon repressor